MTVIAVQKVNDKIEIAYDSRITRDYEKLDSSIVFDKVITYNNILIAVAGGFNENILLREYLKNNELPNSKNMQFVIELMKGYFDYYVELTKSKPECEYIVIKDKKAYFVDGNFSNIWEIKDFKAIGSGEKYATTALHLGKNVFEAVAIACQLDVGCGEPINRITI
jgi:ATP-dependent protease HslVU (ClpYQ) peptidase subunit